MIYEAHFYKVHLLSKQIDAMSPQKNLLAISLKKCWFFSYIL